MPHDAPSHGTLCSLVTVGLRLQSCHHVSKQILAKNPGMAFGEVGKALGAAWGKLSDAEKVLWRGSEWL